MGFQQHFGKIQNLSLFFDIQSFETVRGFGDYVSVMFFNNFCRGGSGMQRIKRSAVNQIVERDIIEIGYFYYGFNVWLPVTGFVMRIRAFGNTKIICNGILLLFFFFA